MLIRSENFKSIENLTKGTHTKVWFTCDVCGMGVLQRYQTYLKQNNGKFCRLCRNKHTASREDVRRKQSMASKKLWEDDEHRKRMSDAHKNYTKEQLRNIMRRRVPSGLEKELDTLLQKNFPGEWKYVGDGEFVLAGKNPDFVNINGKKKIIEVFGNYWHKEEEVAERVGLFAGYGFETLVVWGNELRDEDVLLERLRRF